MFRFYKKLFFPEENVLVITKELFRLLKVSVSVHSIKNLLEAHPDYPSLLSLCDILDHYKVENLAIKAGIGQLKDQEAPYVIMIEDSASHTKNYSVVRASTEESVSYLNPAILDYSTVKWTDLESIYSGVAVFVDANEGSGEKDYIKRKKEEYRERLSWNISILVVPILVVLYCITQLIIQGVASLQMNIHILLSLTGLSTAGLLLWYEVDHSNSVLKNVCGKLGQQGSCDAVLGSKAASIGGFNWSSMGFSYFFSILICQIMFELADRSTYLLGLLSLLSIASIGYVFYSVYYQRFVVKKWCIMCLIVQLVLVLQVINVFFAGWVNSLLMFYFPWQAVSSIGAMFAVSLIVTDRLAVVFKDSKSIKSNNKELKKFKYNPEFFHTLLKRQRRIIHNTDKLGFSFGNKQAKHHILKVCNPYCMPCARAHQDLEALMDSGLDIAIQIIFVASNEINDIRSEPVKHFLAIAETMDDRMLKKALNSWYNAEIKDYKVFMLKHPTPIDIETQRNKVDEMHRWCELTEINFTPTFFINGYEIPPNYNIRDIEYLLKN